MGWLRLVGSLKLYVSFAEYCLFYRALLQKRPIILRSLLIVLQIFGSRDPTIFSLDLLGGGDSVYTPENFDENLGTRVVSHVLLDSNTDVSAYVYM